MWSSDSHQFGSRMFWMADSLPNWKAVVSSLSLSSAPVSYVLVLFLVLSPVLISIATHGRSILGLYLHFLDSLSSHADKLGLSLCLHRDEGVATVSFRTQHRSPRDTNLDITVTATKLQRDGELLALRSLADDQVADDVGELFQAVLGCGICPVCRAAENVLVFRAVTDV